jgi:hypothetical protein
MEIREYRIAPLLRGSSLSTGEKWKTHTEGECKGTTSDEKAAAGLNGCNHLVADQHAPDLFSRHRQEK